MIKIFKILVFIISVGFVTNAQNFTKVPGAATDVAIAPNGSVYVVGTSKRVFKWNNSKKNWDTFYDAGRQAKFIDAQNNYLNTVNSRGQLYTTNTSTKSSRLLKSLGSGLKDYGQKGAMILSTGIALNQPARDKKQTLADAPINNKVAAVNEQSMYVIKNDKSIWFCQRNKKGVKLPGAALDIAYDPIKKKVYVIGTSKRIFVWNASRRNWDTVRNTRNDFANLAVNNGVIWATTAKGDIYTTASTSSGTSNTGVYKLKITLQKVTSFGPINKDGDTFLLAFNPTLKIGSSKTNIKMKDRRYAKMSREIQRYGKGNQLYVTRKRNESDFDKVLIKPGKNLRNTFSINNSGVFEIPKNTPLTESNLDFSIGINFSEVSEGTLYLNRQTAKLNLKEILNYLTGKKSASNYDYDDTQFREEARKLGVGYRTLYLKTQSGKRYIEDNFTGNYSEETNNRKRNVSLRLNRPVSLSTGKVFYTIELID